MCVAAFFQLRFGCECLGRERSGCGKNSNKQRRSKRPDLNLRCLGEKSRGMPWQRRVQFRPTRHQAVHYSGPGNWNEADKLLKRNRSLPNVALGALAVRRAPGTQRRMLVFSCTHGRERDAIAG